MESNKKQGSASGLLNFLGIRQKSTKISYEVDEGKDVKTDLAHSGSLDAGRKSPTAASGENIDVIVDASGNFLPSRFSPSRRSLEIGRLISDVHAPAGKTDTPWHGGLASEPRSPHGASSPLSRSRHGSIDLGRGSDAQAMTFRREVAVPVPLENVRELRRSLEMKRNPDGVSLNPLQQIRDEEKRSKSLDALAPFEAVAAVLLPTSQGVSPRSPSYRMSQGSPTAAEFPGSPSNQSLERRASQMALLENEFQDADDESAPQLLMTSYQQRRHLRGSEDGSPEGSRRSSMQLQRPGDMLQAPVSTPIRGLPEPSRATSAFSSSLFQTTVLKSVDSNPLLRSLPPGEIAEGKALPSFTSNPDLYSDMSDIRAALYETLKK